MVAKKYKSKKDKLIEEWGHNTINDEVGKAERLYNKFIELKGDLLLEQDKDYYKEILNKYFK
jgi:hypothetical protein